MLERYRFYNTMLGLYQVCTKYLVAQSVRSRQGISNLISGFLSIGAAGWEDLSYQMLSSRWSQIRASYQFNKGNNVELMLGAEPDQPASPLECSWVWNLDPNIAGRALVEPGGVVFHGTDSLLLRYIKQNLGYVAEQWLDPNSAMRKFIQGNQQLMRAMAKSLAFFSPAMQLAALSGSKELRRYACCHVGFWYQCASRESVVNFFLQSIVLPESDVKSEVLQVVNRLSSVDALKWLPAEVGGEAQIVANLCHVFGVLCSLSQEYGRTWDQSSALRARKKKAVDLVIERIKALVNAIVNPSISFNTQLDAYKRIIKSIKRDWEYQGVYQARVRTELDKLNAALTGENLNGLRDCSLFTAAPFAVVMASSGPAQSAELQAVLNR